MAVKREPILFRKLDCAGRDFLRICRAAAPGVDWLVRLEPASQRKGTAVLVAGSAVGGGGGDGKGFMGSWKMTAAVAANAVRDAQRRANGPR